MRVPADIHVPILIVGSGPTGLLSANLLGIYGVDCLIIDQNRALCLLYTSDAADE